MSVVNAMPSGSHIETWTGSINNTTSSGSVLGGYYGSALITQFTGYDANKWQRRKIAFVSRITKSGNAGVLGIGTVYSDSIYTNGMNGTYDVYVTVIY